MAERRPTLLLIDGSHALFRAYFAVRHLASPTGQPTGAVFGFVSMLQKLLREKKPDKIAVCFDVSGPTFRHEMSDSYKANRPDMPEDLSQQWPIASRVAEEFGLAVIGVPGLEADDLIATLAKEGQAAGHDVIVVSGDKDLMQLVEDASVGKAGIRQLDDGKNILYDEKAVLAKWGVRRDQVGDLLAIMGDASDNIPGVRGIGEKGAVKLLTDWGSLDAIYANIDKVTPPRAQELLRASEEAARLAQKLVALKCDAVLPFKLDDLKPKAEQRAALAQTFAELGFKRLLAEYAEPVSEAESQRVAIETITDLKDLAGIVEQIRSTRHVAICAVQSHADPERLMPMWGELVGLGLCWSPLHVAYVPMGHKTLGQQLRVDDVLRILAPVLQNPQIAKIGHHAKYDAIALRRAGLQTQGWRGDAMLASYIHEPERHSHSLRNIAFSYCNQVIADDTEVLGKGKAQTGWDAVPIERAAEHVGLRAHLTRLTEQYLRPLLAENALLALYTDLEMPLSDVLADMEFTGIHVDVAELKRQSEWLATEIASEEAQIHEIAGKTFNVGSPSQLAEVLFEELKLPAKKRTQSGYSTDQSVLESLAEAHPLPAKVLRWRQLTKLKGTYTDALPAQIQPQTQRVHTCFQQAVAATGRLSSIEPNLQNIPVRSVEGKRIRQAFVAPQGCLLISADYSQIELRVMAHLANDPGLIAAFRDERDIHRETAARMFNVFPEMVTSEQRSAAKTINFGVLYGMGPQRLSREINVSQKEAKAFIDLYFKQFPGVHGFMERTLDDARRTGEVRTLYGRRRLVANLGSQNHGDKAAAERVAVNSPVQGTAADLIKRAMLTVAAELTNAKLQTKMLLQVHDELVFEAPEGEVDAVTKLVRSAMMAAGQLAVPLQVEVRAGGTWADAH
jgi:DNA polymerase-1